MPLTVTDTGMMRYWITGAHAALVLAHGALLAREGAVLATPHDPAQLSVGELAERIWRAAGAGEDADIELLGIRRGETLTEVLTGPGEQLGPERFQGIAAIDGGVPSAGPAWVAERLEAGMGREAARAVWLEAMRRPGPARPGRLSRALLHGVAGRIRTRRTAAGRLSTLPAIPRHWYVFGSMTSTPDIRLTMAAGFPRRRHPCSRPSSSSHRDRGQESPPAPSELRVSDAGGSHNHHTQREP